MKKKILLISILVVVFALSLCLAACTNANQQVGGGLWAGKPSGSGNNTSTTRPNNPDDDNPPKPPVTEFGAPQNLQIDATGLASWSRVSGAESYDVQVNDTLIEGRMLTSLSLVDLESRPADGVFNVKVRAVASSKKSDWSEVITYTHKGSQMVYPMLSYDSNKLVWGSSALATSVLVTVDSEQITLAGNASEYDLSQVGKDATISVQFVGDGVYVLNSKTVSVTYNNKTGKVSLPSPTNVRMEGPNLLFEEVYGANIYYLQDVNNTVTQIKDIEYWQADSSEEDANLSVDLRTIFSDRTNKFLIKSVWAGNTDIQIENSVGAEVVYFNESQGLGTAADPYKISNPEEMRFIEYYESLNLAKYYILTSDIVLEKIDPKPDDDVSNFYTLGSLSGVIDGNGKTLKNLTVYYKDGYSSIFDSITPSGVIKNLVIEDSNWRTWTNRTNDGVFHEKGGECSILAYSNRGTIENVVVKNAKITAVKDGASGLVSINKGTIKNCVIESDTIIYGENEAGGIAIKNAGTIEGCINKGSVAGSKVIGGIVGRNNGIVSQCGNEGKITANIYGGGICGYNYNIFDGSLQYPSTIKECYNYGAIEVTSYGGGICGKNGGNGVNETGENKTTNAYILSCYNLGLIKGSNSLGGIVGENYGFHKTASDLGVVNCYSNGSFEVSTENLSSTRIFLSLAKCSWGADHDAVLYCHYWSDTEQSDFPGIKMMQVTISGRKYYYADISVKAQDLKGLIFSRRSPTGQEWNKSDDITGSFKAGNLCFEIDSDWSTATAISSASLVNNAPLAFGGIAGYSNMINDCYFKADKVSGKTLTSSLAGNGLTNTVYIDGEKSTSAKCEINNETLLADLNKVNDVWVQGENGPKLKWQTL